MPETVPWLQYTAVLAQYHFWSGNKDRGDQLLSAIDRYRNDQGEIPEHLSTCKRFEWFMEKEWDPGEEFAKEIPQADLERGRRFRLHPGKGDQRRAGSPQPPGASGGSIRVGQKPQP